jgi:hypothetical protein
VSIAHRLPELERAQHIAIDVNVAGQIRIGKRDLVKTHEGSHRVVVVQPHIEAGRPLSKVPDFAAREVYLERRARGVKCPRDAIEPKPSLCGRRYVRIAMALPARDFFGHAAASLWPIPFRPICTPPAKSPPTA